MISGSRLAESGVSSAGLSTTVQPAARHGASFQVASMNGAFHGVISPATPTGWRMHVAELLAGLRRRRRASGHDQVGEVAEVLGGAVGLAARLGDRQAGVERLQLGQLARRWASIASAIVRQDRGPAARGAMSATARR